MGFTDDLLKSPSNNGIVVLKPKLSLSGGGLRRRDSKTSKDSNINNRSVPRFDQLLRRSSSRLGGKHHHDDGMSVVSARSTGQSTVATTNSRRSTTSRRSRTGSRSRKKRVKFKRNASKEIFTDVSPTVVTLRNRDVKKLWITDEESDATAEQVIRVIQSFRKREDYVQSFITAFTNCARASENERDVKRLGKVIQGHTQKAARGLEIQILSVLDAYRSKHVQAVLETQNAMKGLVDPVMQEQIIAERSRLYSKPGRMFARVLAYTDQRLAKKQRK